MRVLRPRWGAGVPGQGQAEEGLSPDELVARVSAGRSREALGGTGGSPLEGSLLQPLDHFDRLEGRSLSQVGEAAGGAHVLHTHGICVHMRVPPPPHATRPPPPFPAAVLDQPGILAAAGWTRLPAAWRGERPVPGGPEQG